MKITWEAGDVRPGRRVRKPDCVEVWMIGYDPSTHGEKTPALAIVSLSDGAICVKGKNREEIAAHLNQSGEHPVELVGERA
jgi:hypothetical protein